MIDGVHAGDHREQYLRRADVRRRFFAPDVLLASLQCEPVRGLAVRVDRHTDEAARHRALELVLRREIAGVRAAVAHRHAKALRRADDDVSAPLAGRGEQRKREKVGGDDDVRALRMQRRDERAVIADIAPGARVLQQRAEALGVGSARRRTRDDFDVERRRARAHDVDRLRKHVVGDEEALRLAPRDALGERHRFGGGGGFVQHRRIGNRHAGQIAHHRLEIDQRFEPSLRYFRLVRRVRGVPRRTLEHVAQDDARRVGAVVALTDEGFQNFVLRGHRLQARERCRLGRRGGQAERRPAADRFGNDCVHERRARRITQCLEHRGLIVGCGPNVARDERVVLLERCQRLGGAAPGSGIVHVAGAAADTARRRSRAPKFNDVAIVRRRRSRLRTLSRREGLRQPRARRGATGRTTRRRRPC